MSSARALAEEILNFVNQAVSDRTQLDCAELLAEMCDPYVPYDTGKLASNITITPDGVKYNQPYAEKCYEGLDVPFRKEKHPLATAHWDEVMLQNQGDEFNKRCEEIIIENATKIRIV